MKSTISDVQKKIKVGTHGEDYGSWMSNPVFYVFGGIALVTLVLTALSFTVFRITVLGVVFAAATVILVALLCWMAWIRRQYAFGKGGMMEKVHQTILSSLDFDGHGSLLEVGCGSGALAVRAALTWPEAKITGLDYWGAMYNYSKALCEKNAASEGVGKQCGFVHGDANKLDFPDGSFDAVISNYVYHNIMGADKHALLLESLRVLKKGGVFVLHDNMKPQMYGDMNAFVEELRHGLCRGSVCGDRRENFRLEAACRYDDAGQLGHDRWKKITPEIGVGDNPYEKSLCKIAICKAI